MRSAQERHHLRLKIGREPRERLGCDIDRLYTVATAFDLQALVRLGDIDPSQIELFAKRANQIETPAQKFDFAAAYRGGQHICAQLDSVGDNGVCRSAEAVNALNGNCGGAIAINLRAHAAQAIRKVHDFRLAGGVVDDGCAFGQSGGHHDVFGRTDRGKGEINHSTFETPSRSFCVKIAITQVDVGPHFGQPVGVNIHGSRANSTAPGKDTSA